jgi:membrane peptidoglycan carboxypeptidase
VASIAVFVMLTGIGFVGGTYYVDGVETGDMLTFPETTSIYYSDGTLLAKLGQKTRYPVEFTDMNDAITEAMVASEDATFWTNEGVDFRGVMRAAWNNFTGGTTQGASTIAQQYARLVFDLKGATYNRKLREAVLAWKMSDELSKEDILESYLNSVAFGRNTYGAEAAAKAYFGKTINRTAPPEQQVSKAEAMALVSMVKQPEPDPDNPDEFPGYDPTRSEKALENATGRWGYVRDQMVELNKAYPEKYLTPEQANELVFPPVETWLKYEPTLGQGEEKPAGLVINHVLDELTHTEGSQFKDWPWENIESGGYSIYTTLDPRAQAAAEGAADDTVPGAILHGQPANLQAALVAVEPGTGRILAYFGGHDGKGADYAGFYYDEAMVATGVGRFPPGSSWKVYDVAAALKAGFSLKSYWQWTEHEQPGRNPNNPIRNASRCAPDWDAATKQAKTGACTLLQSTIDSLNVPFYDITQNVGAVRVLEMARDAGVNYIWNDARERQDLRGGPLQSLPPGIGLELGIGQYPITVMDHANGMATFAAGGLRATAHFVKEVTKNGETLYGETLPNPNQGRILNPQQSNDLNYALSQVAPGMNISGFQAATKTGTWEYNQRLDQNAHAWNVGYTNKLAAAVWVGNEKDEQAIVTANGSTIWGSGFPRAIWQKFMADATNAMGLPKDRTQFNQPNFIGDELPPGAIPSPTPSPTPEPEPTTPPPTNPPSVGPSKSGSPGPGH